jgi:hypothetical protein
MKRSITALLLGSLCAVSTALATTYVRVEKDGTKTYSDRPIPGGKAIDLEPAQSYPAQPAPANSNLPREQQLVQEVDSFTYQSCGVTPENDATLFNPEVVSIAVVTAPALRPLDTVILTVDGQSVGQPGITSHAMTQPARGTHTVAVTIRNRSGRVLCNVTSSFHVQRPSINTPGRR